MYLFFDTETTGLPRNWKAPVTDLNNWPRMVQIAWILFDIHGTEVTSKAHIIKPEGFVIPHEVTRVHGISTERALQEGVDLSRVLNTFNLDVERADTLVAHNISFDEKIIGAEFLRKKISTSFGMKNKICTMHSSTNLCRIPGPYGYKWPKLAELHRTLFGADFEEAHNALVDIEATARCFWEMRRIGAI
jgi:DNA polymerase III subunit epsilon